MKFLSLAFALTLSTAALADGVELNRDGSIATITGALNSTSSEVLNYIGRAHDLGFKDSKGADFFVLTKKQQGMRRFMMLNSPAMTTAVDSAFAVIYKTEFRGNRADMAVNNDRTVLSIKGESARLLMGALATVNKMDNTRPQPVGVGRQVSVSGKIVCTRVVVPGAVANCLLKL